MPNLPPWPLKMDSSFTQPIETLLGFQDCTGAIHSRRDKRSPFTACRSPLAVRRSPFTVRRSSLTVRRSPFGPGVAQSKPDQSHSCSYWKPPGSPFTVRVWGSEFGVLPSDS